MSLLFKRHMTSESPSRPANAQLSGTQVHSSQTSDTPAAKTSPLEKLAFFPGSCTMPIRHNPLKGRAGKSVSGSRKVA